MSNTELNIIYLMLAVYGHNLVDCTKNYWDCGSVEKFMLKKLQIFDFKYKSKMHKFLNCTLNKNAITKFKTIIDDLKARTNKSICDHLKYHLIAPLNNIIFEYYNSFYDWSLYNE